MVNHGNVKNVDLKDHKIKFYLETYGCTANLFDSEVVISILLDKGLLKVDNPESSDIILINTCIVKGPTERKMEKRIKELKKFGKPIIVLGCYSEVFSKKLIQAYNVSCVGVFNYNKIYEAIIETLNGNIVNYNDIEFLSNDKIEFHKYCTNPVTGIVVISDGCTGNCSYCIVKLARGYLRSVDLEKIVNHIKYLLKEKGVKEIYLTSQDTGIYGIDKGYNLVKLIKNILKETEGFEYKIRIGMMNPKSFLLMKEDLLDCFEDNRLYRFLHLPVQSGSNKVLKDMNRYYTAEDFVDAVKYIREFDKLFNVVTDIIVGFPTETEEDLEETIELLKESSPDNVFLSRFEPRPYTIASEMKQIPGWEIKERSRKIHKIIKEISLKRNEMWIGKKCKILINEKETGRNDYYKVVVLDKDYPLGSFIEAKIKKVDYQQLYI